MSIPTMAFTPTGGLTDATSFPDPATESAARLQVQTPSNQLRDYINTNFVQLFEDLTFITLRGIRRII